MIFNVFLTGLLAAAAAALPHSARSGESGAVETRDSGSGSLQIVNNMGTDVYLWTTSSEAGSMETISTGGDYSEGWITNSDGGGISIKMSTSENEDSVLQFEYTQDGNTLYWDMSSINLDASSDFIKSGFTVVPSDSSCKTVSCPAGDVDCKDAYQLPDDVNTYSCSLSAGFTLTLG
ncbi:GPI anchored cell wall protein, putative [Penicillium digitatum]|jgi:hypothetical protein|uniref:GPI anchored cell wall protein, putative n=3 Tax=Penicillium digitatum TaxID=36651 RepID=K9GJA3_PEND2|nr:GPI anchored cell wall protein, putative [Penicillium digitatum Pd1]EKV09421.1 GPI anchored cell wall protein, putative [Penicillium digitatum Pd1]EKV14788.1 GPI anchored cell wall protein, putative [Penicillium digitatum PHI26]MCT5295054.1 hypothetical protein [Pseudomonas aeruginosa]QQK44684.1 GPI anchored cell wall protein, putative [Penicillium digitatum]